MASDERQDDAVLAALRRTGQVELALHALAALEGSDAAHPRKLQQLRDGWDSSAKFLSNVLAELARRGLVGSGRSHHGGYFLLRPLEEIALLDVLAAVGLPTERPATRATPHWDLIAAHLREALAPLSVGQLVAQLEASAADAQLDPV